MVIVLEKVALPSLEPIISVIRCLQSHGKMVLFTCDMESHEQNKSLKLWFQRLP